MTWVDKVSDGGRKYTVLAWSFFWLCFILILLLLAAVAYNLHTFIRAIFIPREQVRQDALLDEARQILASSAPRTPSAGNKLGADAGPDADGLTVDEERPTPTERQSELALEGLWRKNQRLLLVYHEIAANQATSGYNAARRAAAVGMVLMGGTIAAALFAPNSTASIVAGVVGTSGTAMTGYVASTYVRLQQGTSDQLRSYFDNPVEMSRILAAERLVAQLSTEEAKDAGLMAIVEALANPAHSQPNP